MNTFAIPSPGFLPIRRPPGWLVGLLVLLSMAGGIGLLAGSLVEPNRTWTAFLVNFLFWISIAHFGVVFPVILTLAHGRWAKGYLRLAQSLAAFLPIAFLLFLVFIVFAAELFPWVREPLPEKALWLNYPFMAVRVGFGLFVLMALSLTFLFYSLRLDAQRLAPTGGRWAGRIYALLTVNFGDWNTEVKLCRQRAEFLAPAIAVLYCFVFSLMAGDLIMSLAPHWYSTLFGAYYFIGSIYLGLAFLAVASGVLRKPLGLDRLVTERSRHDLGKLLFGFCLMSVDMFWSQYLVIWYGNIPEEAAFIALRIHDDSWRLLAWAVMALCFIIPFLSLISKAVKQNPLSLTAVGSVILVGYFLERILLVVPSLAPTLQCGWIEISLTLGFLALFVLSALSFLLVFPPALEVARTTEPQSAGDV